MATSTTATAPTTLLGRFFAWCKEFVLAWLDVLRYAFPTIIAIVVCVHYTDYRGIIHITSPANWFGFLSTLIWSVICRVYRTPGWWAIVAFLNYAVVASCQSSVDHHGNCAGGHGHAVKQSWFASHWSQIKTWTLYWLPTMITAVLVAAAYNWNYLPFGWRMVTLMWTMASSNAVFIWWWTVRHNGH